jgi:two-component system sensor histidine kinase FlrB
LWRTVVARAVDPNPSGAGHDVVLRSGRLVGLTTCPLGGEPGQIILLQDVTEDRRLQETLGQHRRLVDMGRMAASLAHQIRTPLSSALLYASHLRNPELAEHKRGRFAEKVVDSLRSLERLINDMLVFSRGGGGEWQVFSPNELLRTAREAMAESLAQAQIHLRIEVLDDDLSLRGNRTLLLSALQNLVSNAVEATEAGGRVTLSARAVKGGEAVEIEVADRGAGLPEDMGERIFEPFVTTRSGGTGLGLAVVRAVARTHRGEVWARPREGGGTCVTLRLPTYAVPTEASPMRLAQA